MKGSMHSDLLQLSRAIAYDFRDKSLLNAALSHRSADSKNNNERLEFLGDAVLSLACANFLFEHSARFNEGDLSRLRAQFVCQENLWQGAERLKLGDYIICDKAMRASGAQRSPAILADALEALFGAAFIDGGLATAEKLIFHILGEPSLLVNEIGRDAKSRLQEYVQGQKLAAPRYIVLEKLGPAHAPDFRMGVEIDGEIVAEARGDNKKSAEQKAAQNALDKLLN
jgi:ribonuclease-3